MIRMAGEDLLGTIELLAEHRADEEVGPSHGPEREEIVRARPNRIGMAVRAADEEGDGRAAALPFGDQFGEIRARNVLAALVEGNNQCAIRESGEQQFAFTDLAFRRGQLAPLLDLPNVERPCQAFGIETLQIEMRSGSGAADRDDQDAQGAAR